MKKLIISALFAVTLLTIVFLGGVSAYADAPLSDIAPTQLQSSNTYYSYDFETKTLTISGTGAIPNFTNSSGASTSQPWFEWRSDGSIEHLVVEEGITSIGNYAFYAISVQEVSLPSTLVTIGSSSMASMNIVSPLTLPEGLKTISSNGFYYSRGIESITIPSTVTSIGASAFECCYNLKNVEFENLTARVTIGKRAFFKCSELETITLPKNASLQAYSVGFYQASTGSVYDTTTMRVFKNSPAYNYAVKYYINYELIEKIPITEGECMASMFTSSDLDDSISFSFTPEVSAEYQFFSVGDIDLKCELKSGETVIAQNDDVSSQDTDFYISQYLSAGTEYVFVVTTNHFEGSFEVNLIPKNVTEITCSVTELEMSADEQVYGKYDVLSKLSDAQLDFTFDTGYQGSVTVGDGAYRYYCNVEYSDNQYTTIWYCGEYKAYVGIGGAFSEIDVKINHSYGQEVVEPTYTEKGYTIYTCIGCDDTYIGDYTDSLGKLVRGRAVLMESPDGSHPHNFTLAYIDVSVDDIRMRTTALDGEFEFWVDADCQALKLAGTAAIPRTVSLDAVDGVVDLGDVPLLCFDYYADGYINAKDYAVVREVFGYYGVGLYEIVDTIDYNHDGILNDKDWLGAGANSFFNYGKLDDSIY